MSADRSGAEVAGPKSERRESPEGDFFGGQKNVEPRQFALADMSKGPVYQRRKLRLVVGAGLRKDLLQLTADRRWCDAHRARGNFQPLTACNGDRRLSL